MRDPPAEGAPAEGAWQLTTPQRKVPPTPNGCAPQGAYRKVPGICSNVAICPDFFMILSWNKTLAAIHPLPSVNLVHELPLFAYPQRFETALTLRAAKFPPCRRDNRLDL